MSGAATSRNQNTAKATTDDTQKTPSDLQKQAQEKKTQLEEDDEFEDFPMEDWPDDQIDLVKGGEAGAHLWEESWDDDETSDDFAKMLNEELRRVGDGQQNGKN